MWSVPTGGTLFSLTKERHSHALHRMDAPEDILPYDRSQIRKEKILYDCANMNYLKEKEIRGPGRWAGHCQELEGQANGEPVCNGCGVSV